MTPALRLGVSAAVHEAHAAGLLEDLVDGGGTAEALAVRRGLDPRLLRLLLDVLVEVGLAAREADHYAASPALGASAREVPGGLTVQREVWAGLGARLRGLAAPWEDRSARYPAMVGGLAGLWGDAPARLAAAVGQGAPVLDVGCGTGVWGRGLLAPGGLLAGLDLPEVLAAFEAACAGAGVRSEALPGDMHTTPLPRARFARVVLANVVRLETPERAAALVARAFEAVAPGGALVIVDALDGGTPEADLARTVYALHLGLRLGTGTVHTPDTVERWLREAGAIRVDAVALGGVPGALGARVGWAP